MVAERSLRQIRGVGRLGLELRGKWQALWPARNSTRTTAVYIASYDGPHFRILKYACLYRIHMFPTEVPFVVSDAFGLY